MEDFARNFGVEFLCRGAIFSRCRRRGFYLKSFVCVRVGDGGGGENRDCRKGGRIEDRDLIW